MMYVFLSSLACLPVMDFYLSDSLFQGTLSPIVKVPSAAIPSEEALEALEKLSADPRNLVYIISGRDSAFLEQHLGHLKNVGFSAEHGGFFRERKADEWTNLTKSLDMSWMSEVEEIFRYYTEVCVALLTLSCSEC